MTFTIPIWLLWTLYIAFGVVGVMVAAFILAFVLLGVAYARALGRDLDW